MHGRGVDVLTDSVVAVVTSVGFVVVIPSVVPTVVVSSVDCVVVADFVAVVSFAGFVVDSVDSDAIVVGGTGVVEMKFSHLIPV